MERYNPSTFQKETVLQITPQVETDLAGRSLQQMSGTLAVAQDGAAP